MTNSTQKPNDAWSKFAVSIIDLNGLIMRAGDSIAQPIGQSSARWHVLARAYESQTVAKMARDMGHARQSVQRVADVLEKEGLVVYKAHPTNRRTQLVELTPQGREVFSAIYQRQLEWSERIVTKLDPAQLSQLADALTNIAQILATVVNVDDTNIDDKEMTI